MERLRDDERDLARRLEAYAEIRLRPDPVAMTRMRSALVAEARRRAAPMPLRRRAAWRMGAGLLAAAAVLALGVGSAAASHAGGPLYGARLWVEQATLPSDASARVEAEMTRLDARLAELRAALAARDAGAADAALEAYRSILSETVGGPPADGDTIERLEAAISKHLDVLRGLLATAPTQALDGLRNAIDRSDNGLRELERRSSGEPGNEPSTPPGQASTPPGQASTPPGQASTPPNPSPRAGEPSPPPDGSAKPHGTKQGTAKP